MRSVLVFLLLSLVKLLSRIFYRQKLVWIGLGTKPSWRGIRIVAFLNHTSLYEPLFLGVVSFGFLWRIARHGVIPAADKTIDRPLVGHFYRFLAGNVVSITRQRDDSWAAVLDQIDPDSMVLIAPEGRMKRENGLDLQGNPMTVRGGIADILESVKNGRMLLAYSGGLHQVQVPGQRFPALFRTIRIAVETVSIETYTSDILRQHGPEAFKRAVREDLERRRDLHCPLEA